MYRSVYEPGGGGGGLGAPKIFQEAIFGAKKKTLGNTIWFSGKQRCPKLQREMSWKGALRYSAVARKTEQICTRGSIWPPPFANKGLIFSLSTAYSCYM